MLSSAFASVWVHCLLASLPPTCPPFLAFLGGEGRIRTPGTACADCMEIAIEGMKPATLRAGLRRALKGKEDVKLAQRGEETYLVLRKPD
jgi:hypothetical protein